jgi:hypothetical protein
MGCARARGARHRAAVVVPVVVAEHRHHGRLHPAAGLGQHGGVVVDLTGATFVDSAVLIIGALIVVGADLIARTAFPPYDIPAGVFTAGIGAPFFIYLLFRSK